MKNKTVKYKKLTHKDLIKFSKVHNKAIENSRERRQEENIKLANFINKKEK